MNKSFRLVLIFLTLFILIITGFRNYYLPFNHDESATFFHFVQIGDFLPFKSMPDANNHFLNSLLSFISFKIFGSTPFALRLPNFFALFILILAIIRLIPHLRNTISLLVLFIGFLFSFHWLSVFNISRGYGLSMAFLLLSIPFLIYYLKNHKTKHLIFFFVYLQVALSANLTLLITSFLLTGVILHYQFRNKLFSTHLWIIGGLHLLILAYWVNYSFYLMENNALYYGSGTSYFNSTFHSLVELFTGYSNSVLTIIVISVSGAIIIYNLSRGIGVLGNSILFRDFAFTFSFITISLVIGYYLLNIFAGINFPEDRTGLFFYVFIVLTFVFTIDNTFNKYYKYTIIPILFLALIHFFSQLNFTRHSVPMYATLPHFFYDKLQSEQKINNHKITIGGYRMSELSFNFMNYRKGGHLNAMDPYEQIQMQCDYQVADRNDFKFYQEYYEEIAYDKNHDFVLLKRKEVIERILIYSAQEVYLDGNQEFFNILEISDVNISSSKPLIAEINFAVLEAMKPLNAWIVFYGEGKEGTFYERLPLNWMKFDWNGKSEQYHLITGTLPTSFDKIVVYLWNIKKEPLKMNVQQTNIYQVDGKGVNVSVKD